MQYYTSNNFRHTIIWNTLILAPKQKKRKRVDFSDGLKNDYFSL